MEIDVLTLFPKMFVSLDESIIGKAQTSGLVTVHVTDFRDFSKEKHHHVDDYPFGGGVGMILQAQPVLDAYKNISLRAHKNNIPTGRVILTDPAGEKFTEKVAKDLSKEKHLTFICGHYEGYDERISSIVTDRYSIGDYVLTGGELPTMVMIDAIVRLLPGVLGNENSTVDESFSNNLLEYPQYTRPANFNGMQVPKVLLSGHHKNINRWRIKESLRKTYLYRPELLKNSNLSTLQLKLLKEIRDETN